AMKELGFATAIWTNNDRVVADFVLARFDLLPHLDLIVTRDEMRRLKPDPDGLRVVRPRWPEACPSSPTARTAPRWSSVESSSRRRSTRCSICPPRSRNPYNSARGPVRHPAVLR